MPTVNSPIVILVGDCFQFYGFCIPYDQISYDLNYPKHGYRLRRLKKWSLPSSVKMMGLENLKIFNQANYRKYKQSREDSKQKERYLKNI